MAVSTLVRRESSKPQNSTTVVIRHAMSIVSKDVIAPKVVRQGIVKSPSTGNKKR